MSNHGPEKWGFWQIKRVTSSAWIHTINLRLKSSISGIFRTDIYSFVWNICTKQGPKIVGFYCRYLPSGSCVDHLKEQQSLETSKGVNRVFLQNEGCIFNVGKTQKEEYS